MESGVLVAHVTCTQYMKQSINNIVFSLSDFYENAYAGASFAKFKIQGSFVLGVFHKERACLVMILNRDQ